MMIRQRRSKGSFIFFFPWKFANQMVQKICSSALDVELMIKKGFSFLSYFFL